MPSIKRQVLIRHLAWACAKLGPPQTRDLVVDKYLVVDNKKAKQTLKNNNFRQQNSFPFQLKRKTTLIVDNKCGYFVVDNSFSLVCETVSDNYTFQSMFVARRFFPCTRTDMRSER